MLPIPIVNASNASQRAGSILREVAPRSDRVPADDRVDLPEIQESFRVSFSDQVRVRDSANQPDRPPIPAEGLIPTGVEAYRRIAEL